MVKKIICEACDAEMKEKERYYAITGDVDEGPPVPVALYACTVCDKEQMERVQE